MKISKLALISLAVIPLSGCFGQSSYDNETTGQVKKVVANNPIICDRHHSVDISLGVIRNGVGSMSNQDQWYYIDNDDKDVVNVLKKASETGALVKIVYDIDRITPFCRNQDHHIKSVSIL